MTMPLRLGTRGSALALAQSQLVADELKRAAGVEVELVVIRTVGDVTPGPLSVMKQPGVFVSALRDALIAGEVDFVVHSMKDLPSAQPFGVAIAAFAEGKLKRIDIAGGPAQTLANAREPRGGAWAPDGTILF